MQKALYRLYRPLVFDDVVGQHHIVRTLKNQIQNNSIAHAYLFSGTRGTGKTSTAKIFARAVNCLNPIDSNPCNECEICRGILNESIMDVIEIDAASNNGVDDIREIRENVKYPPAKSKYKVYIIDEVHMLSQGAFNALLKTLEEPPSHVIFILATTEYHKMPATILSRCQKFDFKRVSNYDMGVRLQQICTDIDVQINEDALNLICINAQGALRDALSILDQCVSYCEKEIKYEDVTNLLGSINVEHLFAMAQSVVEKDVKRSIQILNDILTIGKDIKIFLNDLINHFRSLMVCKISLNSEEILALPNEFIEKLKNQSEVLSVEEIIGIINILCECESQMKYSTNARIIVEICLIKISKGIMNDTESILERIKKLENMVKNQSSLNAEHIKPNQEHTKKEEKPIRRVYDGDIKKIWPEILEYIKKDRNIPMQAMLKEASEFIENENKLIIVFEDVYEILKQRLSQEKSKSYIKDAIKAVSGKDMIIDFKLASEVFGQNNEKDEGLNILDSIFPSELIEIKDK